MPGAPGTHQVLTASGAQTFTAGKRIKFDMSQLASLSDFSGKQPYLRALTVRITGIFNNSGGAPVTIDRRKKYDIFKRIEFYIQSHVFLDLLATGGRSLFLANFVQFGKLPENFVDVVVPNGGSAAFTVTWIINCYEPRQTAGVKEEKVIPLGLLLGGALEFDWCPTGEFNPAGAATPITVDPTTVLTVTAEIILRDQTLFPALWTWQERVQSGMDDFIDPARVLLTDLYLQNLLPQGPGFTGLTVANVTQVNFFENGLKTADAQLPDDIVSLYNHQTALSSEGYAQTQASGNCDFLPFKWLPRSSGKLTHLSAAMNKPRLKLTGNLGATPGNVQVLEHFIEPTGPASVADMAAKIGIRLPDQFKSAPNVFLAAKSAAKTPVAMAKSAFLGQKLYRRGTPAVQAQLATQGKMTSSAPASSGQ